LSEGLDVNTLSAVRISNLMKDDVNQQTASTFIYVHPYGTVTV